MNVRTQQKEEQVDVYQEWVEKGGIRILVFHCDGQEFDRLDDALAYRHNKKNAYRARRKK